MMAKAITEMKYLRNEVARYKGIAKRAHASSQELRQKALDADAIVRKTQSEIEAMGGKVRR